MADAFHEARFPISVARGARGGPVRKTDVVTLASGREHRNARWAHSLRKYDAGYGVKTLDELAGVIAFFEERRGKLTGFRWRDRLDCRSCSPSRASTPLDQQLGTGDGARSVFQLVKRYGAAHAPYLRPITKPVTGTVRIAVNGVEKAEGVAFTCDATTGLVTFMPGHVPAAGASVTAGFEFDVPVRFDTDEIEVDLSAFDAGDIPKIPLIEILP
jgi:uncharacterized protein (TIGR02217 family)